jgi:hypothetical protein
MLLECFVIAQFLHCNYIRYYSLSQGYLIFKTFRGLRLLPSLVVNALIFSGFSFIFNVNCKRLGQSSEHAKH